MKPVTAQSSQPEITESVESAAKFRNIVKLAEGPVSSGLVYLVHAQGGLVMMYSDLSAHMAKSHSVYGVRAIGLNDGELPLDNVTDMARAYATEISKHCKGGSVIIGGYCMGGAIAWETAQELTRLGCKVRLLLLIQTFHKDMRYPSLVDGRMSYAGGATAVENVEIRVTDIKNRLKRYFKHGWTPQSVVESLKNTVIQRRIRKLNSTGNAELDLVGGDVRLLQVHNANERAFWQYEPDATQLPVGFVTTIDQPHQYKDDLYLGWRHLTNQVAGTCRVGGSYLDGVADLDGKAISDFVENLTCE